MGMLPFERGLVALPSYVSSMFTRFRDIAAFVLQHATFSHPTSSLPKFPHVPLGLGKSIDRVGFLGLAVGLRRAKMLR